MLYKFKSAAAADVIMLEPDGRRILELIGKDGSSPGIVTAGQIPGAISALESAIAAEETASRPDAGQDDDDGDDAKKREAVRLRQRAAPFIDLLKRSAAEKRDVTWGV